MKLFRKNKDRGSLSAADAAAGWIAAAIEHVQRKWAAGMTKVFSRLSHRAEKAITICCFLLMAGYSTIIVAAAFNKPDNLFHMTAHLVKLHPIVTKQPVNGVLPEGVASRINRFKKYLDSLSTTKDGIKVRDSLLKTRPGLLDSLQQIETIYCHK